MKTEKMKTSKMKTSINLKTRKMKNNYLKNTLKLGMTAIFIMALGTANAQTTNGSGASVRVIDNKGTIKYLQTNNGITSITSAAAGNKTTTTWQLGGTLTESTTIATDGTNTLNITGLEAEGSGITGAATTGTLNASGYTLVVRDEVTGALKKILAADILAGAAITGIRKNLPQTGDAIAPFDINVSGLPIIDATNNFKLSVYRNGVKLRFGTDFTSTVAATLNITADATDLPIYDGDVFEVHYLN
jgi:uncharacterized protein GlcG (DUF336 family)